MTAKEYLSRLKMLRVKGNQLKKEKRSLRESLSELSGIDYSKDRVSGGPASTDASFANKVMRILEIEEECDNLDDEYKKLRHKIIGQIHDLQNINHIRLLFKVYVEDKSLKRAAQEMNYTYQYVRELHQKALAEFETTYTNLP